MGNDTHNASLILRLQFWLHYICWEKSKTCQVWRRGNIYTWRFVFQTPGWCVNFCGTWIWVNFYRSTKWKTKSSDWRNISCTKRYDEILSKLQSEHKDLVIGTDQNVDLLNTSPPYTRSMLDILYSSGTLPTVTRPTRVCYQQLPDRPVSHILARLW
jgi:hypothetical protein